VSYRIGKKLYCLVFILLLVGCNFYSSNALAGMDRQSLGLDAPNFTLEDLSGTQVSLQEYRGKVVLLVFWATWCRACREAMPTLKDLWSEFEYEDFVILAVSVDRASVGKVNAYCETKGLSFPVLLDSNKEVGKLYSVSALPTTYIINKHGKIRGKIIGARNWSSEASKKAVNSLIEED